MKKVYPIFIKESKGNYLVFVPGMNLYTEGKDMVDAIEMARDVIALEGLEIEKREGAFPSPISVERAQEMAEKDADEYCDYSEGILTLVDVDFEGYKKKLDNRAMKKSVTLPYWLNQEAEKEGINFSRVLQEALKEKLGIS